MANNDNLIPFRSEDEARENGKKGGIASGKARRAKKIAAKTYSDAMKELMRLAYRTDLSTKEVKETCEAFGLRPEQSGAVALAFSDFFRAINGDADSMERVLSATGSETAACGDSRYEPTSIFVLPSAREGEDVIGSSAAEATDNESS